MADVFISYSRRDLPFARRLTGALREARKSVFIDVGEVMGGEFDTPESHPLAELMGVSEAAEGSGIEGARSEASDTVRARSEVTGILPSARWMEEIERAIAGADAVVFLISPDSMSSRVCLDQELQVAKRLNKRLVPVRPILTLNQSDDHPGGTWTTRATPDNMIPDDLAELNFVPFGSDDPTAMAHTVEDEQFTQSVTRLVRILDTDIERYHEHTRLLEKAEEWEASGHDRSRLLRGHQLDQAQRWLEEGGLPRPTDSQRALIAESGRGRARRQRRWLTSAVVLAVVMGAVAALALVSRSQAVRESHVALSGQLASGSVAAANSSVPVQDILALEAYQRSPTVAARSALVGGTEQPLERILHAGVGGINSVAYDPEGPYLAAGGDHGAAIFDAAGRVTRRVDTNRTVNSVAFSQDGSLLALGEGGTSGAAVGSEGGRIHLIRPATGATVGQAVEGAEVGAVAFSAMGSKLAAAVGSDVYLFDLTDGTSSHTQVAPDASLLTLSFSPDDSLLAVGGSSDETSLLDVYALNGDSGLGTPVASYTEQDAAVADVSFSPDGSTLAAVGDDDYLRLFNPANLDQTDKINLGSEGNSVAFSPNGSLIATGDSQNAVRIWSTANLDEVGGAMGNGSVVYGVAFSKDGHTVAAGGFGGVVGLWSASVRSPVTSTITDVSSVQDLSVNSTGSLVAAVDGNGTVTVWNSRSKLRTRDLDGTYPASAVAFDPHHATGLAVGDTAGNTHLYDVDSQESLHLGQQSSAVVFETFAPNGKLLAAATIDGAVTVWNLAEKKVVKSYPVGSGAGGVSAIAFSPDSKLLAVAHLNSGIAVHEVDAPGNPVRGISVDESIQSLAFSPDGSELAGGDGQGNVELFATSSGQPGGTLQGDGSAIFALAFSPDNGTLATGDFAGDLRFWDPSSRQQLGTGTSTGSTIFSLDFGPPGSFLATGSGNGDVVLWPSLLWSENLHSFSDDLCPRLGANLTQQEWHQYVEGQPYHATCPTYPPGQ